MAPFLQKLDRQVLLVTDGARVVADRAQVDANVRGRASAVRERGAPLRGS
jgi:hypothetical protein